MEKLLVGLLGNRDAGKSSTWYRMFEGKVKTGKNERPLYLFDKEYVDAFLISGSPEERKKEVENILPKETREFVNVFLVNGSPEERETDVNNIIPTNLPNIVLCSIQYVEHGKKTIQYFIDNGYHIYIIWINPGYNDKNTISDDLDFLKFVNNTKGQFKSVDGKGNINIRAIEIKKYIREWAKYKGLLKCMAT